MSTGNLIGKTFLVPTSEGDPYRFQISKRHHEFDYWVCVCLGGGHPARRRGIHIFSTTDIAKYGAR
jgi:hypothetical protein